MLDNFFHFDILPCTKIKPLWMCLLYILYIVIRQRHIYLEYELIYMHIAKICLISCSVYTWHLNIRKFIEPKTFKLWISYTESISWNVLTLTGEKVGEGHMCLWCGDNGKTFQSVQAVQKHMVDKCHCKILFEKVSALEFADFYDYRWEISWCIYCILGKYLHQFYFCRFDSALSMAEFKTGQILLNKNANLSWDNLRVGEMICWCERAKINLSENNYVYSVILYKNANWKRQTTSQTLCSLWIFKLLRFFQFLFEIWFWLDV